MQAQPEPQPEQQPDPEAATPSASEGKPEGTVSPDAVTQISEPRTLPHSTLYQHPPAIMPSQEQCKAAYNGLSESEKWTVNRAMEYANKGEYRDATASFVSDCGKIGKNVGFLGFIILEGCTESPDKFFEGLMGFYM
ncbi:hypothetical protein ACJZ2D_009271 [Fusarium nematophilum]